MRQTPERSCAERCAVWIRIRAAIEALPRLSGGRPASPKLIAFPGDRLGFIDVLWQCSPDGTRLALTLGRGGGPELWTVRNLPWTK